MREPTFPDESVHTVADLHDHYLGRDFWGDDALPGDHPDADDTPYWQCDYCSRGVSFHGGCTGWAYLADRVLGELPFAQAVNAKRPLAHLASYCDECLAGQQRLLFPERGALEVRVRFALDGERRFTRFDPTDISPRDDGIPWDPEAFVEAVTGAPFDEMARLGDDLELWGPENMVTWFLAIDESLDIREVFDHRGEMDAKQIGRARREWTAFMNETIRRGDMHAVFKERVEDRR